MNIEKTIRSLTSRGFTVKHFATGAEAAAYLAEEIRDTEVGFGGCQTAADMNLYDILSENNKCYWHWKSDNAVDAISKANEAPVYITSANAIAETGEIINIDGRGNRLAAQVYGIGKKVYIIAGTNKIAPDFTSAVERARQVAAVRRGKDFPFNTPCKIDDKCHDCRAKERFCNAMLVLMGPMFDMAGMEVVLIDEAMGY
ncbi:MAG: LUD domain-containing protein [Lachnospiraceae bacterium]|nr:LUD domain-containing protein [Candidatus Equihabitans merdae]